MNAEIYNWNRHEEVIRSPIRTPMVPIQIGDETWRDGMQGTQALHHPNIEAKKKYLETVSRFGYVDNLDIGFPASGPIHRKEIIELIKFASDQKLNLTFSAAGRGAAIDDGKSILEVAQKTGTKVRADLFLDASSIRAEIEGWNREEKLKQTMKNIIFLKKEGLPVMFVPERSSATLPEELFEACVMAADEGVDRIAIADTTGILNSKGTQNLLREVFEKIGKRYSEIKFDFHGHNDLEMGIANCLVAGMEGVDCLHATARGIGERVGNVNLEKLLVILDINKLRKIDGSHIQEFAKLAADILSIPIASHEPFIGERSTETASGVHASTYEKVLKGENLPNIYLPFVPEEYGLKTLVKVGPFSGLANVRMACGRLGITDITEEKAQEILDIAKAEYRILSDEDVKNIVGRNGELTGK